MQKYFQSYNNNQTATDSNSLTSFDSDGFTLGSNGAINNNNNITAAWCWKEGATPGFDVVSYNGVSGNQNISHSLGVKPAVMLVKSTNLEQDWVMWHQTQGSGYYFQFNSENVRDTSGTIWGSPSDTGVQPTSTVFTVGDSPKTGQNGDSYLAYLWAEVDGFSRFHDYVGNGNSDGPFVYCGFRPSLVIVHKSVGSTDHWFWWDSTRDPYNKTYRYLRSNNQTSENTDNTNAHIDILSNGFKIRTSGTNINQNGGKHLFLAWAENPFGGQDISPASAR